MRGVLSLLVTAATTLLQAPLLTPILDGSNSRKLWSQEVRLKKVRHNLYQDEQTGSCLEVWSCGFEGGAAVLEYSGGRGVVRSGRWRCDVSGYYVEEECS